MSAQQKPKKYPYTDGYYVVYANASHDFRDYVRSNNLEMAKKSIDDSGLFIVTDSEVKHAAMCGSFNVLKWLIEELHVKPCGKAASYALERQQYEEVLYLLKHDGYVNVNYMFTDYRVPKETEKLCAESIKKFKDSGVYFDNKYKKSSIYFQFMMAFAKHYNEVITIANAFYIFCSYFLNWKDNVKNDLSETDILLTLDLIKGSIRCSDNHDSKYIRYVTILMGKADIWYKLMDLPLESMPIDILNECISNIHYEKEEHIKNLMFENLMSYLKKYKCVIDSKNNKNMSDYCFRTDMNEKLKQLLTTIEMDTDTFVSLLYNAKNMNSKCVEILLDYGKNDLINRISNETKKDIIHKSIETYRFDNLMMTLIESLNYTDKIKWIDIKKEYGISRAEDAREVMIKNNSKVIDLIDFDESDVSIEEKWVWWGIKGIYNKDRNGTYQLFDYNDLLKLTDNEIFDKLKEQFNDIKTFDDLEKNINMLSETIDSPTACYFHLDRKTGIFYRDQQACVIWALSEDNRVYVYEYGEFPYKISYVAKSLPEFLTRIKYESYRFY